MANSKELYDAAVMIKKECKNAQFEEGKCVLENGNRCPFGTKDGACTLFWGTPEDWDIPRQRRFTDAEIAIAKALKAFGCDTIRKPKNCCFCVAYDGERLEATLPTSSFTEISDGEEVLIEDILSEKD